MKSDSSPGAARDFSEIFVFKNDRKTQNIKIPIPENLGKGYLSRIGLGGSMGMMIHDYELLTDINGQKSGEASKKDTIVFSFRNVLAQDKRAPNTNNKLPSVLVSSGDMEIDFSFAAHTRINAIVITVHKSLLLELIHNDDTTLLQTIFSGNKPYLYEEFISPGIQDVAAQIFNTDVNEDLLAFYYRVKVEELILLFFIELLKRKTLGNYPLNSSDVKTVYKVRDKIISDLTTPPNLASLAAFAGMSESKLNRLFKQIFGNPIYNYHQKFRIYEAAKLLKTNQISVSEVGYQLGFTNLSHFSKLFHRYIGDKPKKFSKREANLNQ